MAHNERSTVVGVFERYDQAERCLEELRRGGVKDEHVKVAAHRQGGLLDALASLFGGTLRGSQELYLSLVGMGIPADEARYYQREFDNRRTILLVKADGHLQDVLGVMERNGAIKELGVRTEEYEGPTGRYSEFPETGPEQSAMPGQGEEYITGDEIRWVRSGDSDLPGEGYLILPDHEHDYLRGRCTVCGESRI